MIAGGTNSPGCGSARTLAQRKITRPLASMPAIQRSSRSLASPSITGPKAGGPNYLRRFATEQTVTVNTAAAGGNATLLSAEE
jgi:hypothetical protein